MSDDIEQAIHRAFATVSDHPGHWLTPMQRWSLYEILDPTKAAPMQTQVRPWLELLAAKHVLPQWQAILQDRQMIWEAEAEVPSLMVELTTGLLQGALFKTSVVKSTSWAQVMPDSMLQKLEDLSLQELASHWLEVADLTGELTISQYYPAWCVFDATLTALCYALGRDFFAYEKLTADTTEITSRYSDAANWAAVAYVGGLWQPDFNAPKEYGRTVGVWNFDRDNDRIRRQEFWEWWLFEAIPEAREQSRRYR